MSKKQLDSASVVTVVNEILAKFGSTTNLDIKHALRSKGFWATQQNVSDIMAQLVDTEDWEVTNNGSYNTYTAATPQSQSPVTASVTSVPTNVDDVAGTVTSLFGIHKFAMSAKTRLSDLGFNYAEIEKLTDELGAKLKKTVNAALKTASTTLGDLQDYFNDSDQTNTQSIVQADGTVQTNVVYPVPAYKVSHPQSNVNAFGQPMRKRRTPRVNISPLSGVAVGLKIADLIELADNNELDQEAWVLSVNGQASTRTVFNGDETRDHVRTAYARLMNVPIQRVRARRVKNMDNELAYTGVLPTI